jgi:uncharacterized protein with GYD domain
MPKYLIRASYTSEGVKGVLSEGGSSRKQAVSKLVEDLGGKLESMYFAFGEDDVIVIIDFPDNVTATAVSMTVAATDLVRTQTTVLLTPEELDEAARKSVPFRGPGR